jgi:hypothetical protein
MYLKALEIKKNLANKSLEKVRKMQWSYDKSLGFNLKLI